MPKGTGIIIQECYYCDECNLFYYVVLVMKEQLFLVLLNSKTSLGGSNAPNSKVLHSIALLTFNIFIRRMNKYQFGSKMEE